VLVNHVVIISFLLMLLFTAGVVTVAILRPNGLHAAKRRTAIFFGFWAALCVLVALMVVIKVINLEPTEIPYTWSQTLSMAEEASPFCVPAGIAAGIGWWLLHRQDRQLGWRCYGLFAVGVVLVDHVLLIGPFVMLSPGTFVDKTKDLVATFVFHGWLTLPMALVGTYIFVAWNRRRLAAINPR
jgi:hypothetical protein